MSGLIDLLSVIQRVVDALDQVRIPYLLVGSFSSMYYSFPRSTTDVDFVIGVSDPNLAQLATSLGDQFLLDPQLAFETVGGSLKNEIAVVGTPFKIELFRLTDTPFDQSRFSRRRRVALVGREVWIQSAEDVVIQKLLWDRPKDREDIIGVIASNHQTLDRDYMESWCEQTGTVGTLRELWATATSAT